MAHELPSVSALKSILYVFVVLLVLGKLAPDTATACAPVIIEVKFGVITAGPNTGPVGLKISLILNDPVNGVAPLKITFTLAPSPAHVCVFEAPEILPLDAGCTVTVIVNGALGHPGVIVEVAVTIYCTEPEVLVLGFESI